MSLPAEMRTFVRYLNYPGPPEPFDEQTWIEGAVKRLKAEARATVHQFLFEKLIGGATDSQLQDIWAESGPDYIMSDKDLRVFLGFMLEALGKAGAGK